MCKQTQTTRQSHFSNVGLATNSQTAKLSVLSALKLALIILHGCELSKLLISIGEIVLQYSMLLCQPKMGT